MQVRDQGNERPAVYVYSTFCVRLASLADSDCHENVYPAAQTVSMNRILVCLNSTAGLDRSRTHTKTDKSRVIRTHPYCGKTDNIAMLILNSCKTSQISPLLTVKLRITL